MSLIKIERSAILKQYNAVVKYYITYLNEEPYVSLNEGELNQLSEAYNYILDEKRKCVQELEDYFGSQSGVIDEESKLAITSMFDKMQNDLIATCTEIINIINTNLLQNVEGIREKAFIYKMKGDYYRYMWEINKCDDGANKEATKSYYEALSLCQWNLKPTDKYLLEVAMNYSVHLKNTNNVDKAKTILEGVINEALEYMEEDDMTNKSLVDMYLIDLNKTLKQFQVIAEQQIIEEIELYRELEFEERFWFLLCEELVSENSFLRQRG